MQKNLSEHSSLPRRREARGFTLVELLVAVAIGLIILGLAVPVLREIRRPPLTQATRDFTEACQFARSKAIIEGHAMQLVFRYGGAHMSVQQAPDVFGGPTTGISADPTDAFKAWEIVDKDVLVEQLEVDGRRSDEFMTDVDVGFAVRFFPNGTASSFQALLSDRQTYQKRRISVEVLTGLPMVEDVK